ncbi:CCA-adding enzyme [Pseudoprimorskyibacter insulae]|uniref:CCA-adding enzyme n=2 Tax=Pseudoprimorskyibacter insulae TaxID=1695997 RepID=A0A2R8ATH1_9RHOB|nr:CCA-adding enzyme [Pseudoprimorskyibacter insulae]
MSMLTRAGYEAYLVGGCVRNALLGAPVDDIDICTNARPDVVMTLATDAGMKPIPTGIDHGTITVVTKGIPHEITTYRADVETDGRHAVVRFSNLMEEDARRRDFTMNALYADQTGQVHDPVGGLPDLAARRVRYIDDPATRIREDYLRILRFFRFNAWYGDPAGGFDADALDGIARNLDGISSLSRERVGSEIAKLVRAPDPAPAIAAMDHTGALAACLPGAVARGLPVLIHLEQSHTIAPDPLRRLAGMGYFDGAALRLPKTDQRRLTTYQTLMGSAEGAAELGYRHGYDIARDVLLLRSAQFEQPLAADALPEAQRGARAVFPVAASDLMPALQGKALGDRLRALEDKWVQSGFALTKDQLLG